MTYWFTSLALLVFGFLGALSIGQPFFWVGLTMLLLGAFRGRPLIFWPPLLGVIAYNLAFLAVAPFYCTASSPIGGTGKTVCTSLIGLRCIGEGSFNPSLMPAVMVGWLVAGLTAAAVFAFLHWKRRTRSIEPTG